MRTVASLAPAALIPLLIACEPAPSPAATDPVALMRAADSAASSVMAVEYDFTLSGSGDLEEMIPPFTGSARAGKTADGEFPLLLVDFTADTLETGDILPSLTIASDGDSAWVLDESALLLSRGSLEAGATDLLEFAFYGLMIEYVVDDPFVSEIEADSIALEGVDSVGGVECDVIFVVYQDGIESARWFIGRDDHLPRRVERFSSEEGMNGAQILEISNLAVLDPAPGPEAYRLTDIPDGVATEDYSSVLGIGSTAPDWTLETPDGTQVTLSELAGNVVVLDFWATWCGPCASAMPGIQALYEEFEGRPVRIIGVNVWEDGDPAAFMAENGFTYPIVVGGDEVADAYLVTGIPTFYVIGTDGRVVYSSRGYDPEGEQTLRSQIEAALAAQ